jgi:hypothetical protein
MAFRIEKRISAFLILSMGLATSALAQPVSYEVRHKHARRGAVGLLRITDSGIALEESGKERKHARQWSYPDIEQLTLRDDSLSILTYEDVRWQLGRDRVYDFDRLPEGASASLYRIFRERLDQRFVAALADTEVKPLWQTGAKLLRGRSGSQGVLLVGANQIVFQSSDRGVSRTWRLMDIDMVSSSGPFDLAITTMERTNWHRGSPTELRFQLKEGLAENHYQQLWRMVNQTKGLQLLPGSETLEQQIGSTR